MGNLWNGLLELIGSGLSAFYDIIPNYGVAIILLTIVISVLLFPLTLKQTRSMKAMQEIQPEVKRLQKELKGDRERLNQELMALYKERNVNPAAGCLPMIVQLPIWFALFRALRSPEEFVPASSALADYLTGRGNNIDGAFELTDFLGMNLQWSPSQVFTDASIVTTLPYVVAIIVVMATGYYQTRQTMARQAKNGPQQPQQQTMQTVMKFFPIIFGVISWSLPAGLVLYFAVSQVFRIGQQAVILRLEERRPVVAAPAAETARAKADAGEAASAKPNEAAGQAPPPPRGQPRSKKKRKRRRK